MRSTRWGVVLALGFVLLASCATKPPTPEPTPEPTVEPTVAPSPEPAPEPTIEPAQPAFDMDALDSLKAEVLAMRKHSFDLGIPEVLPDDWDAADASYVRGIAAYEAKDWQASLDALTLSRAAFEELLPKGLVLLVERARALSDDARLDAVNADAPTTSEERFAAGEAAYAEADALVSADSLEDSLGDWELSRAIYELAQKHARALSLEYLVEERSYAPWDSGNADTALAKLADENILFREDAGRSLEVVSRGIDLLDEVILRYNLVISKGMEGVALAARGRTEESRDRSKAIRADIAAKYEYDAAAELFGAASADLAAGLMVEAATGFDEATTGFDEAYAIAADKRQAALDAMQEADSARASSEQAAVEADAILAESAAAATDEGGDSPSGDGGN